MVSNLTEPGRSWHFVSIELHIQPVSSSIMRDEISREFFIAIRLGHMTTHSTTINDNLQISISSSTAINYKKESEKKRMQSAIFISINITGKVILYISCGDYYGDSSVFSQDIQKKKDSGVKSITQDTYLRDYPYFGPIHPQHKYSTERQQNWTFARPTHPLLLLM